MEKMPRSPESTLAAFASVSPGGPEAMERKMFGMAAAFVHGNLFMGLFGDDFQVRLPEAARAEVLAAGGTPFSPGGRTMREYVILPAAVVADDAALRGWVARASAYAAALPVKDPKAASEAGEARAVVPAPAAPEALRTATTPRVRVRAPRLCVRAGCPRPRSA